MDHNTTSGSHESHGAAIAHLCPKCRWPFPNPHPSAKHRRAHKRVCGTIQGYELDMVVDPTLSDDDHNETPSPIVKEKGDCDKSGGGIGERSNRSEDELFSDAVTEFSDSGFSPGVEESLKDFKVAATRDKDLTVFHSFKDNAPDLTEPSSNSTVSSQMENPEVHENATALLGGNQVSQVHVSSSTEESAGVDVREVLMTHVGQETDAKGSNKINPDGNAVPSLASEHPDQTSEAESNCEETEKMTTGPVPASEVVLSKEEHGAEMASKMCSGDPMPRVESLKLSDAVDTAQNKVDTEQGLDFTDSVNSNEGFSEKKANENFYQLSVPSIPMVEHAEKMLEDYKDHKGVKLHQPVILDNDNVYELSVPADIPVVVHAGTMLEGFKDLKGVKLHQLVTLDSFELTKDKKIDVDDHPSDVRSKVSASDLQAVEDNLIHKDDMPVVAKSSFENVNDEPQFKLTSKEGSEELRVQADAVMIGTEKNNVVGSMENQQPSDVSDDSLQMVAQETAVKDLYDVNPTGAPLEANIIGLHETVNHESLTSETCNVIDNDEKERIKEEFFAENKITNSYSVTDPPQFQGNPATNLDGSKDAGDHEKGEIEKYEAGVESKEEPSEGKVLLESKTASDSDNNLQEAQVAAEHVRDASVMKLSETKLSNVDEFSETLGVTKQLEVGGNDKEQGERAKHGRDIDLIDRTSVDHETKASLLSPLDTETSVQGSDTVDDNSAVEQVMGHSGINQSSREENDDNNSVKHQIGASAIDGSVDSLSQTDSLEGNWGSISVLSTQSEVPAVIDAENLSNDNVNLKKPEGGIGRQHSDKSDVFEAPSFMTLVEPGSMSDEKPSASDKQTVENQQQQNPSKAGWFPSLTNVVNDSQGRKKNEAIIAKVTNWSAGKPHTPLKNLLGEAYLETKPKSPNPKENKARVIQKDETAAKDVGSLPMTVGAILGPEEQAAELAKRDAGKEVNSLTGYPTDIKSEKRKVKGRPYWAQFVCCSSVN